MMRSILNNKLSVSAVALAVAAVGADSAVAQEQRVLNVYSHRHYGIDQQINERFTEETGIEINVVNANADQLIERLRQEGENSPADMLITTDAAQIQRAAEAGLLQQVDSEVLEQQIPEGFRDEDGKWFGYTQRARVIVTAKDRVEEGEIESYEDLADPQWRGRLLIRSSSSGYNQALLASIIAAHGEDEATTWAEGVVNNMARDPQGGDRDQFRAVAAGLADVAVGNSYYMGLLANSEDSSDREVYEQLRIVFPNQDGRGTHVNISGMGVTTHAENVDEAREYMEFLVSDDVQQQLVRGSYEFPISGDLSLVDLHEQWGEFEADTETLPELGEHLETALEVFDIAGWE